MSRSTRLAGPGASRVLGAAWVAVLLGSVVAPPAQAGPATGPTAVVSLGDSYISGEAGRWQGNSVDPVPGNDGTDRACAPAGAGCQVDKSRVYVDGTAADGCHRSDVAEVLSARLPVARQINLACSGAVTKNLFRASSGGVPQNGEPLQADKLAQVARDDNVRMVVVSIGGNDLGFAGIVATCFENYLTKQGPCEPKQQQALDQAVPKATADVEKAIDEVRAVMAADGYRAADYRLVLQTYPSVIPRASEARYSELDPQRSNACPFYDEDLTWGRDQASPEIGGVVKTAAAARGVEVMDLGNALQGHELCSRSDSQVTPVSPPSSITSEWGRFLGASTILEGDLQETFHPNAFAQHALGVCLAQLYADAPALFACGDIPGQDDNAMVLRRVGAIPGQAAPGGPGGRSGHTPRCVDRHHFVVPLHYTRRGRVTRVVVFVNRHQVRVAHGHDVRRVAVPHVPAVGRFSVIVVAQTTRGWRVTSTRTYVGCRQTRRREHVSRR